MIDPPPKMSWVKKGFLMSAANNKPFLAQLIFGGGSINARSGLVEFSIGYNITTISLQDRPTISLQYSQDATHNIQKLKANYL